MKILSFRKLLKEADLNIDVSGDIISTFQDLTKLQQKGAKYGISPYYGHGEKEFDKILNNDVYQDRKVKVNFSLGPDDTTFNHSTSADIQCVQKRKGDTIMWMVSSSRYFKFKLIAHNGDIAERAVYEIKVLENKGFDTGLGGVTAADKFIRINKYKRK